MPTITLNKTVFEKLVGKKLPLEQLKDRISMLGTDLEKIEDDEIIVEVFPNRPDMLSEQGFARAFASFIGVKTGLREYQVKKSGMKVIVDKSVTMRPYTICALVKNLAFTDEKIREMMQIQEKLATTHGRNRKKSAYGIYPADKITFPITYIAKDPAKVLFKPLGFARPVLASQVLQDHPKGKAYAHVTAGWTKYPFFIDAKNNVMCMLPFTNSEDTGKVDVNTKDVFVECTGMDFENVKIALHILVTMLADMGGKIYSIEMVYPDKTIHAPDLTPRKMNLDLEYLNRKLGLKLQEKETVILLEKMGFGFEQGRVLIPAYRADILHQIDLVEDIAIAYGYENFQAEIPQVSTIGAEDPLAKFSDKIREIAVGLHLLEVKNYHLLTKEDLTAKMLLTAPPIALKNALGDNNHLRNFLLPMLLKNLAENQHHEYPQRIFELGRAFEYDAKSETGVGEKEKLSIVLAHEEADFTEIKQVLDALISSLGKNCSVQESMHPSFIPGRVGNIVLDGKNIGIIGEFHPQVLANWNLFMPTVGLELDVEELFKLLN